MIEGDKQFLPDPGIIHIMINIVKKFRRLICTRYPEIPAVHPYVFDFLKKEEIVKAGNQEGIATIQLVQDRLYFLLFGALGWKLRAHGINRIDAISVNSINGAIGTTWRAKVFRSAVVIKLFVNRWLRAFGDTVDRVAYRSATWRHPLSDLTDWFRANRHWNRLKACPDIASYAIDGIQVGDLVIDSYLRFHPAPEFEVENPFVRALLWQAQRDIRMSTRYFRRARPRLYLTSHATYLEHGIPARVALKNGTEVWSFGNLNTFGKKLTLEDAYHTRDTSNYRRIFEMLDKQEERLDAARIQLESRLSGGIDTATSYMKKSAYSSDTSTPLPDGLGGAAVVFLHDFYDSPHVYADLVFDDFWQWICFTIDTLRQAGIRFFLKPHPNQISLSDEVLRRLKEKYPDLCWLDSSIRNTDLAQAGIACGITVYGTVAHELAYLGIPSIGCARHPHHAFDFCRTAKNREEYRRLLQTLSVRPVSDEAMRRQALAFYYMHNLYGEKADLELLHAFVALWKLCNTESSTEAEITAQFRTMTALPAFERFTCEMSR